jgi:hypothetical protein
MALPSAIKLFINPRTGLAFGNFNGTSQITNPTVTLGDTARFEIYLVEDTGINTYPRQEVAFPGTPGIKIAVGPIDEAPQAGTWKVSFGGDTTAALAYNITAAALAAALNGLASITAAGGVTVSKIGDNYNIVFNENGARGDILTDSTALIPLSNATVAKLQIGDSTRPQIALLHLQRTIAGLATSFTATAASAITIASLSAWDGSRATYRASIAPDPKGGSFSLAFDAATGTDVSSASIAVGASAIDVQNALNLGALVDKVSVSQIGAYAYDITVTAEPGTGGLTANGAGLISFSGYVGELSLNTAEAISLLDGAEEVATTLEVEITSDSKTLTVLQIPCTLKNAVIDPGSVQPLILDTYLTEASADGRYARQANNLSDLADINQARTNLGVYSSSSVDTALALKANLSGATFSGNIGMQANQISGVESIFAYALKSDSLTFTNGASPDLPSVLTSFALRLGVTGTNNPRFATIKADNNGGLVDLEGPSNYSVRLSAMGGIQPGLTIRGANAGITFRDSTLQTTAFIPGNYLTATATNALLANYLTTSAAATTYFTIANAAGKADLAGATFTGKVNATSVSGAAGLNVGIGGTSAAATVAGDLWIATGGASLNFRDGTGAWRILAATSNTNSFSAPQIIDTTATTPGLRITQKGAGSALVVEDSTTPDSDAFIIDANGNLGIGVSNNPGSIWTGSSHKLEVNGSAKVGNCYIDPAAAGSYYFHSGNYVYDMFESGGNPFTSGNFSSTDYPLEIELQINGSQYRVPARMINAP